MDPWTAIALIAPTVLDLLFGSKGKSQTQEIKQTTITPPRGIQDPTLGLLLPYMSDMMTRMMSIYGGAGLPSGLSYSSPFGADIMRVLSQNWPDILRAYQSQGKTVNRIPARSDIERRFTRRA